MTTNKAQVRRTVKVLVASRMSVRPALDDGTRDCSGRPVHEQCVRRGEPCRLCGLPLTEPVYVMRPAGTGSIGMPLRHEYIHRTCALGLRDGSRLDRPRFGPRALREMVTA
jgi:hypothetical protein